MSEQASAMGAKSGLYSAVRTIVVDALAAGAGAGLPTNTQYQSEHGFTAGTLQRALVFLQERGAMSVVSRGHRGRFVDWINLAESWQAAGLGPVRLLVPPAGLIEMDVLGEIFAATMTQNGIAHAIEHAHGGHNRLMSASAGIADIVAVSKSTLELVSPTQLPTSTSGALVRELPLNSFYAEGRVVVVRRAGESNQVPRTVAIDRNSPDHVLLTTAQFPPGSHAYVDIEFPRTLAWVLTGKADAAVWHVNRTDVPVELAGFELSPLDARSAASEGADGSRAVLVAASHRPELAAILDVLPLEGLVGIQRENIRAEQLRHAEFTVSARTMA